MGEHGVSWENMEKMESINQMTRNTIFMIQNTVFVTEKLFVDQMTQFSLFHGGI